MTVKHISFQKQDLDLPNLLDDSQQTALDSARNHNTAVIGAPGTGKSTTLLAIALDAAKTGFAPAEILLLTSNRHRAAKLRDQLSLGIGQPTSGALAKTPTSWALEIVKGELLDVQYLSGPEHDSLIEAAIAELSKNGAWAPVFATEAVEAPYFRSEIRTFAELLISHSTTVEELKGLASSAKPANKEWGIVADILKHVEKALTLRSSKIERLTSAEVVRAAATILGSGKVAAPKLLLVDDLQDLPPIAIVLLAAAVGQGARLVVALDPDVSTAAFRGASSSVLRDLEVQIGGALSPIVLKKSHRMSENIAKAVATVSAHIGTAGVESHRQVETAPGGSVLSTTQDSLTNLGGAVAKYLFNRRVEGGVAWHEMAVITRNALQRQDMAKRLAALGIPVSSEGVIKSGHATSAANSLLDFALLAFSKTELTFQELEQVLEGALADINSIELRRLKAALLAEEFLSEGKRTADSLLLAAFNQKGGFATIGSPEAGKLQKLQTLLDKARELAPKSTAEELVYYLLEKSGLLKRLTSRSELAGLVGAEALRQLEAVNALIFDAKVFGEQNPNSPSDLFLRQRRNSRLSADSLVGRAQTMGVVIATAASVVGRGFNTVVVTGLEEGSWPNLRLRGSMLRIPEFLDAKSGLANIDRYRENLEDELRYFVLALSRASESLLIAAVADDEIGPSVFYEMLRDQVEEFPANVISFPSGSRNLVAETRRRISSEVAIGNEPSQEDIALLQLLAEEGVEEAKPDSWLGLLPTSTEEPIFDPEEPVRISPSSIQQVLDNPREWFEKRYFADPSTFAMALGTIFHDALEKHPNGPVTVIKATVESRWDELEFESDWQEITEKQEAEKLFEGIAAYLLDRAKAESAWVASEINVTYADSLIKIEGKVDRVEQKPDGRFQVIDLKTGVNRATSSEAQNHAQLNAYQVCFILGAHTGEFKSEPEKFDGAALLYPKIPSGSGKNKKSYSFVEQLRLDRDGVFAVVESLHEVADKMRGPFLDNYENPLSTGSYGTSKGIDVQNIEEVTE
ncbi:MAG: ATP-dependent helicase [Microbacteriaceae bacterium]|nr:ATP-dependent helicase [Microbacteriaceae bacterium]